jgi:acyl-CoA thioester hydrolase
MRVVMPSFPSHSSRARGPAELTFPRFILETDAMPREDFACAHRLRVRWAEVDMQKIVFNGHYLTYIDTAITEYWRAIGLPYPEGYVARYASDMFLRKATVDYLGSARYDDELDILCRASRLGRSSLTFLFEIWRGATDRLIAAELVYVNADPKSMAAMPLPDEVRERICGFEKTAPAP